MAVSNSYTVNGAIKKTITGGFADIEMSSEDGVKAGCKDYPIPLLNKITVESREGVMFKSTIIYAGYKIVDQMLGTLVAAGSYNPNSPYLKTIIKSGRFGIFEPAHYDSDSGKWVLHDLNDKTIQSLINVGTGTKICVKIDYVRSNSSPATAYVDVPGVASSKISKKEDVDVPRYGEIGTINLVAAETVGFKEVESAERRAWFEIILSSDDLNINLSSYITDPKTTEDIDVTLMAYVGTNPTADNTFPILPMTPSSTPSLNVPFETYEPEIAIFNADQVNNPDNYGDGYGSVANYDVGTDVDTTISINIVAPD